MAFDLSAVVAQATQITEQGNNTGGYENQVKLVYPQEGDLKIKLLFNPKSSVVTRKIERHNINGTKVACPTMYGQQCPVCKELDAINNAKGLDLWKFKKQLRGLAFAQYLGSSYKWEKPEDEPKVGEVVMLMVPWTVYKDLNKIIAEAGAKADQLVACNTGKVIKISRWKEGPQVKYSATVDAWADPYTSCENDAKFEEMLMGLDSLNDKICPSQITEDIMKTCRELSEQLHRDYLQGQVDNYQPQPNANLGNYGQAPQQPSYQPVGGYQAETQSYQPQAPTNFQPQAPTTSGPECMGKFGQPDVDPNKCLICPFEQMCKN